MAVENPVKLSVQAMKMSSIEIFALSVDYDSKSQVAQNFFKSVQNKLEYLWGDRIFEKCGIRRDEGGDGGKTLEIRGKRRLSARDGGANYQQS